MKRKFGGCFRSKDLVSQTNEVICKILAHNIVALIHEMYQLGISSDFGNGAITINSLGGGTCFSARQE